MTSSKENQSVLSLARVLAILGGLLVTVAGVLEFTSLLSRRNIPSLDTIAQRYKLRLCDDCPRVGCGVGVELCQEPCMGCCPDSCGGGCVQVWRRFSLGAWTHNRGCRGHCGDCWQFGLNSLTFQFLVDIPPFFERVFLDGRVLGIFSL